ncbi:MAG: ribosomal protein S18-alanine N-acetyltransferase [Leptospirales bacterium]|nr:ribosomal protein S18-alanine N-acetyltransferase [Leptospirales bacterium]
MTIRKAQLTDIDSVLEIEQESINSWSYDQFIQELNNKFSIFLVAESNNSIVGYAVAWRVADEIQINSISVKKSFRKQGIGCKLLAEIIKNDSDKVYSRAMLDVRSNNIEAINFYTYNGFTKNGIRKNYYNDDDAILMEKILRNED